MIINKVQGQTMPTVEIYFLEHVISHEQLFVTLSRKISMQATKFLVKAYG